MILVFSNDGSLEVRNDTSNFNAEFEGIDVENGVYSFFDDNGRQLLPRFITPNRRGKTFGLFLWGCSGKYELVPGDVKSEELFARLTEVSGIGANEQFRTCEDVIKHLETRGLKRV